ncbi:hypothetical protein T440DRAFT_234319 [Plenodomus tracheiphilus IPT5]|uniref:2EXR domain-containing protein n=1 Tax=Plenodomus tracheiphilus IPT5 TaxID=1408161 RepID=A0A6A7BK31_9PLEO|nr:hypothetical protein T440DRAFT_234319 [Plenodomus tracheiphilus IPT5]
MGILKSLRKLTHKKKVVAPEPTTPPPQTDLGLNFLRLPGEIRNQIYEYAIYPNLTMVQINSTDDAAHLGSNVLSPSIFRASRQVRAEAISNLCANKTFQIFRIKTANVFFDVIGSAISEIKEILLEQNASEIVCTDASKASVAKFFAFMEQASALEFFQVSSLGRIPSLRAGEVHGDFLKRMGEVEARGVRVRQWFGRWGK